VPEFTATLQAALAPGYTLERELTGGGMSRVFVATDVTLGRKVVVKVLPPELAAGVNHERFRREIQVAAQLQHPHIVPLLSAGEQGAIIWYTMPYIQGHSLRDALARGERFAIRDVVRILHEVAEALDYAHGLGVIHRDIKPGNVLVQGSHALVTDFGVSKAISAAMPASGYTSAGMAIGTPAYMAPEQIAADPAADHRMDLYALGLLGYELLTGKVPFKEASPQQTMAAQLTREPAPIETTRADVPAPLAALIKRLLAKSPDDRPATAAEVVAALDTLPTGSGESAAMVPTRRRVAWRSALMALGSVAIFAAAWALGQRSGTVAVTEQFRDSLAVAESAQAFAPAAAMLTREDSMAIAQAVSARMAERPTVPRTSGGVDTLALAQMADSIRSQIQRLVLDSLVRLQTRAAAEMLATRPVAAATAAAALAADAAQVQDNDARAGASLAGAAAGPRGPRRVVVALPRASRDRADLDAVATTLADTLRRAFDAHPRFVAVPADSVAAVLAQSRTLNTLQERLDADVIISITLVPTRDSVVRLVQVRDLHGPSGMAMRVVSTSAPAGSPAAGLDRLVPETFRALQEMDRAARQFRVDGVPSAPRPPATPTQRTPPGI
jgi:eukaryotic-like serine/threonine-protein kinase